ncbi:hypothetical protein D3C78_598710 [compost metagenome]
MAEAGGRILGVVGDEQQLGAFPYEAHHHLPHQVAVQRIQPLQGLIQNEQRRMLDQGSGNQHQALLTKGEGVEGQRPLIL